MKFPAANVALFSIIKLFTVIAAVAVTVAPATIVTSSVAAGTAPPTQVVPSDQFPPPAVDEMFAENKYPVKNVRDIKKNIAFLLFS